MKELSSRQKQIIEISIDIISRKGIQELTMKNLSRELGISEPGIYRHFESKQKILIAVLESFKHQNRLIDNNLPGENENAFQHLKRSITVIMERLNKHPAMSAVIFSEEIFQNENALSEMVKNIMNTTMGFFINIIGKGQRDESIRDDIDKEDLSIIVMGSVRHIVTVWRLSGFSIDLLASGKRLVASLDLMLTK